MQLALEILAWTILVAGLIGGVIGAVLPFVPGPVLIVAVAIVHKLMLPPWLAWGTIVALVFIAVLERVADFLGSAIGARRMGATRWGLAGAAIGGIVGVFFGFIGIFVGPFVGAFVAEILFARRKIEPSIRASVGAGIGAGVALLARVALAMLMVMIVAFDLLFIGP